MDAAKLHGLKQYVDKELNEMTKTVADLHRLTGDDEVEVELLSGRGDEILAPMIGESKSRIERCREAIQQGTRQQMDLQTRCGQVEMKFLSAMRSVYDTMDDHLESLDVGRGDQIRLNRNSLRALRLAKHGAEKVASQQKRYVESQRSLVEAQKQVATEATPNQESQPEVDLRAQRKRLLFQFKETDASRKAQTAREKALLTAHVIPMLGDRATVTMPTDIEHLNRHLRSANSSSSSRRGSQVSMQPHRDTDGRPTNNGRRQLPPVEDEMQETLQRYRGLRRQLDANEHEKQRLAARYNSDLAQSCIAYPSKSTDTLALQWGSADDRPFELLRHDLDREFEAAESEASRVADDIRNLLDERLQPSVSALQDKTNDGCVSSELSLYDRAQLSSIDLRRVRQWHGGVVQHASLDVINPAPSPPTSSAAPRAVDRDTLSTQQEPKDERRHRRLREWKKDQEKMRADASRAREMMLRESGTQSA